MDVEPPPGLSLPPTAPTTATSLTSGAASLHRQTTVPTTARSSTSQTATSLSRTRQRTDDTDTNEREHKSLRIRLLAHVERVGVLKRVTLAKGQEFEVALNEEDDWINEANIPQTGEFPTDKLTEGIKN